mgnify:CR=1 FL=1
MKKNLTDILSKQKLFEFVGCGFNLQCSAPLLPPLAEILWTPLQYHPFPDLSEEEMNKARSNFSGGELTSANFREG